MYSDLPVVYAVGETYQIMFYVAQDAYAWIKIGGSVFDDAVCGNLRSAVGMRRITVPQKTLDAAGGYTLCLERIGKRKCYRTAQKGVTERAFSFRPVPDSGTVRAYMVGDAHGDGARTIAAAKAFGAFDFLIVNGDMSESVDQNSFSVAHNVAAALTGGEKPVVYARGNHENRGATAECLPDYAPVQDGQTYYTFRLGGIWGVVLDCGEDKPDDHPEYGGSARFHAFRLAQTDYLRRVIANAKAEFDAPGVTHRICVVHADFPRVQEPPFDIERALYQSWCNLLSEMRVEVIAAAHLHRYQILHPGDIDLRLSVPCPLVVGTEKKNDRIGGTGFTFSPDGIETQFTFSTGEVLPAVRL